VSWTGRTTRVMNRRWISLQVSGMRASGAGRVWLVCAYNRKGGVREHGESDPAGPGGIAADLVLVERGQALAGLEKLLHPPRFAASGCRRRPRHRQPMRPGGRRPGTGRPCGRPAPVWWRRESPRRARRRGNGRGRRSRSAGRTVPGPLPRVRVGRRRPGRRRPGRSQSCPRCRCTGAGRRGSTRANWPAIRLIRPSNASCQRAGSTL
jgi:hypothetical protein